MSARPPIPDPPYAGACLCGAVRYRLEARPLAINACHCTDCQKLTGATNLLMLIVPSAAFVHDRGDVARYRKRADSGREIELVRCVTCGTRLWHEPLASPEYVFVASGTLDDPSWAVPATHIWTESALPAAHFHDDAALFPAQPATRQALMDAFDRLYPQD